MRFAMHCRGKPPEDAPSSLLMLVSEFAGGGVAILSDTYPRQESGAARNVPEPSAIGTKNEMDGHALVSSAR